MCNKYVLVLPNDAENGKLIWQKRNNFHKDVIRKWEVLISINFYSTRNIETRS